MEKRLSLWNHTFILLIPLLLIISIYLLSKTAIFQQEPSTLSIGITLDLLITIPLIYLLLIRKKNIPAITGVPIFLLGVLLASLIIPFEHQGILDILKLTLLPIIELTAMTFLILKVRKLIKRTRELTANQLDFFDAIHLSLAGIVPKKIVPLIATEVSTLYYAFVQWKKPLPKENQFTYHEKSGSIAVFYAILLMIVPEAIAVHVLLGKWSLAAAWIFTILTIYSALQIFGFARSMNKRFIEINETTLYLRYGMMKTAKIPLDTIFSVETIKGDLKEKNIYRLAFLKEIESPNILLQLTSEATVTSLYGFKKKVKTIAFHVDQRVEFVQALEGNLQY
ncbi:MAG: hypothetical protein ACI837_002035 [Crocinitomicaceae bacterium]|jgi:hypothetical protein